LGKIVGNKPMRRSSTGARWERRNYAYQVGRREPTGKGGKSKKKKKKKAYEAELNRSPLGKAELCL